jgi:hypothetical protein
MLLGPLGGSSTATSSSASSAPTSSSKKKEKKSGATSAAAAAASSPASGSLQSSQKRAVAAPRTPAKQYADAIDTINAMRRCQDATRIQAALVEAERVLRDVRDHEIADPRRHLLAAVTHLGEQLPEGAEKAEANRIALAYAKKAKRQ